MHFIGHGTTPFYHDVLWGLVAGVRTSVARDECFSARLVITTTRCTNPSATMVAI